MFQILIVESSEHEMAISFEPSGMVRPQTSLVHVEFGAKCPFKIHENIFSTGLQSSSIKN